MQSYFNILTFFKVKRSSLAAILKMMSYKKGHHYIYITQPKKESFVDGPFFRLNFVQGHCHI